MLCILYQRICSHGVGSGVTPRKTRKGARLPRPEKLTECQHSVIAEINLKMYYRLCSS